MFKSPNPCSISVLRTQRSLCNQNHLQLQHHHHYNYHPYHYPHHQRNQYYFNRKIVQNNRLRVLKKKKLTLENKSAIEADRRVAEYFKAKKTILVTTWNTAGTCSQSSESKKVLKMYLLILLPKVKHFNDNQVKLFKRKMFSVIDDISSRHIYMTYRCPNQCLKPYFFSFIINKITMNYRFMQ